MKKVFLTVLIAVIATFMVFAQAAQEKAKGPIIWKFSTFDASNSAYAMAYRAMWDKVEAASNGRMKIEMYDLGQLGGEADILTGVQTGSIEAAQVGCALLAGYSDAFNVGDLPFLFDDFDHADRFARTPEAAEMNATLEAHGLKVWYWSILGYRQPNLVKGVINSPNDFKGLKWRTMDSPVQMRTMEALGAIPMVVAYNEIYNALSAGVVDAWMNDGVAFKNLSIYEVAPYYTDIPLFASTQTCVISKKAFDALPADLQQIVSDIVAAELPGVIRTGWVQNRKVLEDLSANYFKGTSVVTDTAPYLVLVQPVYNQLVRNYPVCQKYIDAINRVR